MTAKSVRAQTSNTPTSPAATPGANVVEVAPAARRAFMRPRHWLVMLSFLVFVVTPATLAGVYLYTRAADQYASTVGFTVRQEETSSAYEILGGLSNFSGSSSTDTDILYEFIQSQELVQKVDAALDLRHIYGKPPDDPVFRLAEGASIEDLVAYWPQMVRIFYDPGTGLIEVEVRSFDPEDARDIARKIFDLSSAMINKLSAIARDDATRYAKEELDQAVQRLKVARQALTLFRNQTQIVDPSADIQGQMGLLNSLQAQLAETLIELDLLGEIASDSDPRVAQAKRKIVVIEKRIAEERRKLGTNSGGDSAFADLVGQFEVLQVDREFAEKSYLSALSAYDTAVAEAQRQSRYLAAYVQPTLAETSIYPKREILLAVVSLVLFGAWTILVLVYYSLRDRR